MAKCDPSGGGFKIEPEFLPTEPTGGNLISSGKNPQMISDGVSGKQLDVIVGNAAQFLLSDTPHSEILARERVFINRIDNVASASDTGLTIIAIILGVLLILLILCFLKVKMTRRT